MEVFANEAGALLDGGIDASQTSLDVKSGVRLPTTGTFRARIDDEWITVTSVSGATWTVARAAGGSTGASHSDNAVVTVIVTKEALDALVSVQANGTETSNRRVLNYLHTSVADEPGNSRVNLTPLPRFEQDPTPVSLGGTFSWVNQGGATVTTNARGGEYLYAPAAGGENCRARVVSVGSTWTLVARVTPNILSTGTMNAGLVIRDSSTGRLQVFCRMSTTYRIYQYNSATSYSSSPFNIAVLGERPWWKLEFGGTDTTWSVSPDGWSWLPLVTRSTTGWTATPDQAGFYVNSTSGTYAAGILIDSWQVT